MSGPVILALRALLAAGLYVFLAWALLTLWLEIRQEGTLLVSRKVPPITLSVRDGDLSPQLRHFARPEVTIGRDPACECLISDDSVSAYHARLNYHHGQWWLEDLGSTNGTSLNREKLALPTIVIAGDEIRCGETTLVVVSSGDHLSSPQDRLPSK
jgi:pSer/pThr/pTyr-binding forkhead associated (FHA) protein